MDKRKELAYIREIEELQARRDEQFLEIEKLRDELKKRDKQNAAPLLTRPSLGVQSQ